VPSWEDWSRLVEKRIVLPAASTLLMELACWSGYVVYYRTVLFSRALQIRDSDGLTG
jgi:hypothetical protein